MALAHFHAWLKERGVAPADLGVVSLDDVVPIESPAMLRERQKLNRSAANRVFVWTTRFRQDSATQRLKWLTQSFHRHAPTNVLTTTLVADHPYFGGSGLGMGMDRENTTWGGFPLSLDWFALAREQVVDVIGIEDWLGLNFMYGPASTWEGFQLLGFQAAIFRSGSQGRLPIITWITPSDETNLRLKSASALCQGAKHFFYWTYGPTATSTENYWSDLRSAYDGIVAITRQLAGAEHILAPGHTRPARVALLYSLSSDLWQPFGYIAMAERRLTYFSLIHDQYLVDFLTEGDVEQGRLGNFKVLYVTDPCVSAAACAAIRRWVSSGGWLYGSCAAAGRDEYGEEQAGLADVFGLSPQLAIEVQSGRFDLRGRLNDLPWLDQVRLPSDWEGFGALGLRVKVSQTMAKVTGTFNDGTPAVLTNRFGKGAQVLPREEAQHNRQTIRRAQLIDGLVQNRRNVIEPGFLVVFQSTHLHGLPFAVLTAALGAHGFGGHEAGVLVQPSAQHHLVGEPPASRAKSTKTSWATSWARSLSPSTNRTAVE